jgi:hypothetical protein
VKKKIITKWAESRAQTAGKINSGHKMNLSINLPRKVIKLQFCWGPPPPGGGGAARARYVLLHREVVPQYLGYLTVPSPSHAHICRRHHSVSTQEVSNDTPKLQHGCVRASDLSGTKPFWYRTYRT